MNYAIIDGGVVTQTLKSNFEPDAPFVPVPDTVSAGDLYDAEANTFSPAQPPAPAVRTRLTRLEYRNQFTLQEKAAMYAAAKTDDIVQVLIDDVGASEYIELTEATTHQGVGYLAQIGVIAPERVPEILTGITE